MRSAREVARIMGVEKAPLLNHYRESIAGMPMIRAFGQDQQFMNTNI
jgi:ABC-type multidrug transport system fused ATPase/permease subunit